MRTVGIVGYVLILLLPVINTLCDVWKRYNNKEMEPAMTNTPERCPDCSSPYPGTRLCLCTEKPHDIGRCAGLCDDLWHAAPAPEPVITVSHGAAPGVADAFAPPENCPRCWGHGCYLCNHAGVSEPTVVPTETPRRSTVGYCGICEPPNPNICEHDRMFAQAAVPTGTPRCEKHDKPMSEQKLLSVRKKGDVAKQVPTGAYRCWDCELEDSAAAPTGTGEGSLEQIRKEFGETRNPIELAELLHRTFAIVAALRSQLEEATIPEGKIDAEIVGPIVRKVYGDSAELGHYKLAIEALKKGREGPSKTGPSRTVEQDAAKSEREYDHSDPWNPMGPWDEQ